jgi:hypothetical protein
MKVDGASTGSLRFVRLPMETRSGEIDGDETGDADSHERRRVIVSHSAAIDRREAFFRHCFKHRDSAEEESDRFGEGETEGRKKGELP